MAQESKPDNLNINEGKIGVDTEGESSASQAPKDESEEEDSATPSAEAGSSSTATRKKKSRMKQIKAALAARDKGDGPTKDDPSKAISGLNKAQASELLTMNPALAKELGVEDGGISGSKATDAMKRLNLQDIMTGLAAGGKNVKDMASYKFWQTQPVPRLDDKKENAVEGPFKIIDPEKVPKEPGPLLEGFEWVTMDLTTDGELKEVHELLNGHYVEDKEAMFRFSYSESFLRWALMSPGWRNEWHVGVRASKSQKLVAFISCVPIALRVRQKTLHASEVNFLCIHKKLRSKRLAPVLIKEITRRCYLLSIWQAIYTAGVVLPTPVSTCRYFHRSLDWQKLNEVGFSPLPPNSKPQYQVRKFALPDHTAIKGLRPMESRDIDAVLDLLKRYLAKFEMAPVFTREEVDHWLLPKEDSKSEQVVWSYVVEDHTTKKITDYFSFYLLESTVISSSKHSSVRAAYLYYYATETALQVPFSKPQLKTRLNALINDALILAKRLKFDVFNALTLMDNALFLEQQKFGRGDGQLHYYLYNYNANHIGGGVDKKNEVDEQNCSGLGVVML